MIRSNTKIWNIYDSDVTLYKNRVTNHFLYICRLSLVRSSSSRCCVVNKISAFKRNYSIEDFRYCFCFSSILLYWWMETSFFFVQLNLFSYSIKGTRLLWKIKSKSNNLIVESGLILRIITDYSLQQKIKVRYQWGYPNKSVGYNDQWPQSNKCANELLKGVMFNKIPVKKFKLIGNNTSVTDGSSYINRSIFK